MNPTLEELASLYVLDQLEPAERAALEARLLHDPQLVKLVQELEATLSARIQALPPQAPPAGALARIEAKIDRLPVPGSSGRLGMFRLRWALVGGMAALIAAGVWFTAFQAWHRPSASGRPVVIVAALGSGQSTMAELPLQNEPKGADARFMQLATLAEHYWEKPATLPVNLGASDPNGRAYALFDPNSNQGYLAVRQVPAPVSGHRYHLWVIDTVSGQTRDAGVLPVTPSDSGLFFFSIADLPDNPPQRLNFVITIENADAAAATAPHGKILLGHRPI